MNLFSIEMTVIRKKRKTLAVKIRYGPVVEVFAPYGVSDGDIRKFLESKKSWILSHYEKVKGYPRINLAPEDGETVSMLSREFRVYVIKSDKDEIRLGPDKLVFFETGKKDRQRAFERWQKDQLKKVIAKLIARYEPIMKVKSNGIVIKKQKSRWGWCDCATGELGFNQYLIFQPLKSVESVVVHELAHLSYRGHDQKFYSFVLSVMPDYKKHNKMLVMPR